MKYAARTATQSSLQFICLLGLLGLQAVCQSRAEIVASAEDMLPQFLARILVIASDGTLSDLAVLMYDVAVAAGAQEEDASVTVVEVVKYQAKI